MFRILTRHFSSLICLYIISLLKSALNKTAFRYVCHMYSKVGPYRNIESNMTKTRISHKFRIQGPDSGFTITIRILETENYFHTLGILHELFRRKD